MKTVKNFAKSFILAVSQGSEYCSAGACLKEGTKVSEKTYGDLLRGHPLMALAEKDQFFQVARSGLRQFLATESPLQMMKNGFYFTLKAIFVLKIFQSLSWLFGHV